MAVAVATFDPLHQAVLETLKAAEALITEYPRGGKLLFLLLAGVSATLTFFSSTALVPIGVYVWGPTTTLLLLWLGGTLGGTLGYWLARTLGRRAVIRLLPGARLHRYETFFGTRARWRSILLFRIALQSELPSYVLGLVRYPFPRYLLIILLAELPYVLVVVYLGEAFLERNVLVFAAVFALGIGLTVWAWRSLQQEMRHEA
ncbi:MAG: VTT domain-containing protein [Gemmatimonadaceae bacterium]